MGAAEGNFHHSGDAWDRVVMVFMLQRRKLRHEVRISGISGMFGPDLPVLFRVLRAPGAADPNPGAGNNKKEKLLLGSSLIMIPKDEVH